MSEELRSMVSKELNSDEIQTITQIKLSEIHSSILEFLSICLENPKDECNHVINEISELAQTLMALRVRKALEKSGIDEKSFDASILNVITRTLHSYYKGMLGLEVAPDSAGRVLVRALTTFIHKGVVIKPGSLMLMDSSEAFILEALGYLKVYRIKIYK